MEQSPVTFSPRSCPVRARGICRCKLGLCPGRTMPTKRRCRVFQAPTARIQRATTVYGNGTQLMVDSELLFNSPCLFTALEAFN